MPRLRLRFSPQRRRSSGGLTSAARQAAFESWDSLETRKPANQNNLHSLLNNSGRAVFRPFDTFSIFTKETFLTPRSIPE